MPPRIFKTHTRVRYAETDAAGIVYYNTYFVYFELGRIELFRELGLPYDWRLPIAEAACRFHASAVFDDSIEIHTFLEGLRSCGFRLGNRVYRGSSDGINDDKPKLLAEGHVAMVFVGEDRRPLPLPEAFRQAFEGIA